jgi:hypothetical protein
MSHVRPFRGVRFDLSRVGNDLSSVCCPPESELTPPRRRALLQRNPWNFLRARLGVEDADQKIPASEVRQRGDRIVKRWLEEGVLVQDEVPSFYLYRQTFTATVGGLDDRFSRIGVVVALDPQAILGPGPGPRGTSHTPSVATDLRAFLHAEPFSGIRELVESAPPPAFRFLDDASVEHSLQVLDDPGAVARMRDIFRHTKAAPLDGGSRPGVGPQMAMLVAGDDPGLVLQPVHRVYRHLPEPDLERALEKLGASFSTEDLPYLGADAVEALLATLPESVHGFAMRRRGGAIVRLFQAPVGKFSVPGAPDGLSLDSAVLSAVVERELFGTAAGGARVLQASEGHRAMQLLDSDPDSSVVVLTRPVPTRTLLRIAASGRELGPSLALLHPRPWTGLVSLRADG